MDFTKLIQQLDALLQKFEEIDRIRKYDDFSGLGGDVYIEYVTLCRAAVDRIAGPTSTYADEVRRIADPSARDEGFKIPRLCGVIKALRHDLQNGYLERFQDIAHAEIFSDFLDMAAYLLEKNYKDAAAVMIGGVLESHLRQLCIRHSIEVEVPSGNGTAPKKADTMNTDLAKASVYSKLVQKNVLGWLDLRNKAAHGKYLDYSTDNVRLMLDGVQNFISQFPA
jgi:hypothetical protein